MSRTVDYTSSAARVGPMVDRYRERIDVTLSPSDEMFTGDLDDYLGVAETAIAHIAHRPARRVA